MKIKHYSKEFKLKAVQLVTESGYSRRQAADELGIKRNLIDNWVAKHTEDMEDSSDAFVSIGRFSIAFSEKHGAYVAPGGDIITKDEAMRMLVKMNRIWFGNDFYHQPITQKEAYANFYNVTK